MKFNHKNMRVLLVALALSQVAVTSVEADGRLARLKQIAKDNARARALETANAAKSAKVFTATKAKALAELNLSKQSDPRHEYANKLSLFHSGEMSAKEKLSQVELTARREAATEHMAKNVIRAKQKELKALSFWSFGKKKQLAQEIEEKTKALRTSHPE